MGVVNRTCFIVLVIVLCVSLVVSFQSGKSTEEAFLHQLVDPATGEVDEDTAEILWISCRLDLIHLKEAFGPEEISASTDEVNLKSQSAAKENVRKLITVLLHPQSKQTLLDCVRRNNILFPVSGEEVVGSKIWYTKYLRSLYARPDSFRRNLAGISAAPLASTIGSPNPSPAPSPDLPPSSSQSPLAAPFFPPNLGSSAAEPPTIKKPSVNQGSSSSKAGNDEESNHKTIIIAVVVTAVVTFAVAALFFLCCTRMYRPARHDDERHLLSLSLSDYSIGSSLKSFAHGDSMKEDDTVTYQLYSKNSSHRKKASSLNHASLDKPPSLGNTINTSVESIDTSSNINAQVPTSSLKPPPGRLVTAAPGLPPLKPPPGRADPLPPEPPTSYKPPSSKTGPSPPPPPVPPPPSGNTGPRPAGPPPPPPPKRPGAGPPPPPKIGPAAPRPPPPMGLPSKAPRPPFGPKNQSNTVSGEGAGFSGDTDNPKTKLKPFFWDKVLANPDHSMVWHQIKSGSFQFNEEMIETLFGYTAVDKNKNERKRESSSQDSTPQFIQIIDPKKSQNLAILLRALNVTTAEVCDALHEGNELPAELIRTLLKMAPTQEEELRLRLFNGEFSQLGPAERFLKALVDIPFAFKRLEALLFMCTLEEEVTATKESFDTLELACKELRNSRLFLKLLEAVLKTGNRMNDGTFRGGAQAFRLDTLLKLSDVKGVDGKTTLLHFVVREIIRSEGVKAARLTRESRSFSSIKTEDLLEETNNESDEYYLSLGLQVVSSLSSQLENVKKAAVIDADSLTGTVARLGHSLLKSKNFSNTELKNMQEESEFHQTLMSFVQNAEVDIMSLLEEEKRIMALVKSTGDYFHGNAAKDEGLRLFVIVRDFLIMIDKVCKELREAPKKPAKTQKKGPSAPSPSDSHQPSPDLRQRLFPQVTDRRMDHSSSSSDDES